jgi:hypothetical protein
MSDSTPFDERDEEDSVDDLIAMLADAVHETSNPTDMVHEIIGTAMDANESAGVLGNFVFIGEIIDSEGSANLMVITSEGLPEWIARGMMMTAEDYIIGGVIE